MTVPGLNDVEDDKEKLVVKTGVATIMPNRDKLIKIRKCRNILRLFVSLALIMISLSTIFLTFCYINKIGPFRRIFHGRYPIGHERYGNRKLFEFCEITDNYGLISVPRIHVKYGLFKPVKTLHVYKKKLTVIKHNGTCFVRPMLESQGIQPDWFERIGRINYNEPPKHFVHFHWQLGSSIFSNDYLRENVHEMAAAMCMSRPVFHLKLYTFHNKIRQPCFKKCENCDVKNQYTKWEIVNGRNCEVCHCKNNEGFKSSNQVSDNCKAIRCENKCNGKKLLGCVQCRCADQDQQSVQPDTPGLSKMVVAPIEQKDDETKPQMENVMRVIQDKSKILVNENDQSGNAVTTEPVFQDMLRQQPVYFHAGFQNRKKRSVGDGCKLVAEVFEGYSPLDSGSKMSVDYIHDC